VLLPGSGAEGQADLGLDLDSCQLTTTQIWVCHVQGCLLVSTYSLGCNPNPTLQDAETMKSVIRRLLQDSVGRATASQLLWPAELSPGVK
jgi:hypothetical protein